MESLGSYLRTQRESQLLSLEDVSTLTKIKVSFLVAIEEDSYDLLPSPFYAKGYLITYAGCLGLDPKDLLLRYGDFLKDLMSPKPLDLAADDRYLWKRESASGTGGVWPSLRLKAFTTSLGATVSVS